MPIWERGKENERSLLFFPCTAEPVWAFEGTLRLLARKWHVFQVIYDGHQMETPATLPAWSRRWTKWSPI